MPLDDTPPDRVRAAFVDAVTTRVLRRDPSTSPVRRTMTVLTCVLVVLATVVLTGFLVEYLGGGKPTAQAARPGDAVPVSSVPPGGSMPAGVPQGAGPGGPAGDGPAGGGPGGGGPGGGVVAGPPRGAVSGPIGATTPTQAPQAAPATPAATNAPAQQQAAAAAAAYTAISGVSCGNNNSRNWYRNGSSAGWSDIKGGYSGDGCSGGALSMPMSGGSGATGQNYVVWWFQTAPVVDGTCTFSVYIPNSGVAKDVAGNPAVYKILGGRTAVTPYARFELNQTTNRGRWVTTGSVAVHGGGISLHLADSGRNPNGERIGAAQVRVTCKA